MLVWNATLAAVGAVLLALGLSSGLIKNRWLMSEPLAALFAGALIGPLLRNQGSLVIGVPELEFIEEAARITLTIALVDAAMSLPRTYVTKTWRPLAGMLGLVMPIMWIIATGLAMLVLKWPFALALTVGAIATPTDPVLAGSIVAGRLSERYLPAGLRRLITAESGANDALALPLVSLGLLIDDGASRSWPAWAANVLGLQVAGGIALGAAAGWLTAKALSWARSKFDAERASLTSVALALAIMLLGVMRLIGSDGVLAAFVAGLVLNRFLSGELSAQRRLFHETTRRFFELPIFMLLGAVLPFGEWTALGWPVWLFAGSVLLLRRLPAVWSTQRLIEPIETRCDTLFVGWFGPIGIAALYYAAMAARDTGDERIWTVATLLVTASIVAHGFTATHFTRLYGRARRADASRT